MTKPTRELQLAPETPSALEVSRPQPTVGEMLQAVIDKGITNENVGALEKIVALYERMEDKKAEREFTAAFVRLQAEMRSVRASRTVPNNDGSVRYTFAPFEDIMKEVGPKLEANGFTVTFSTDFAEGRLIKSCTLSHASGHSKTNKFAVRIGAGPPKASECQADGSASTYAKRFALCDLLNIQIDKDTDARAEGGSITPEQAEELSRRVQETNSDREKFLKYAGAKEFKDIPSAMYNKLDDFLARKEQSGR
jgi:hypothetical protein